MPVYISTCIYDMSVCLGNLYSLKGRLGFNPSSICPAMYLFYFFNGIYI